MKAITLIFFTFLFSLNPIAQTNYLEGTEFWLGFMENMDNSQVSDLAITSNNGASGLVEIPASGWSQAFTVSPEGSVEVHLPLAITQPSATGTFPFGVRVTSDDTISVYAINRTGASDDATMVKPKRALGFNYYISAWQEPSPKNDLSEFIIVSTGDETTVKITDLTGDVSTITLNEGELYQYQSGTELTGTLIESVCNLDGKSHPIAVFSGARATCVGGVIARDHLYSQLYPIEEWGTSFNMAPLPHSNDYFFHIIASKDGTIVTADGGDYYLDKGDFFELNQIGPSYISANNPISVQLYKRGLGFLTDNILDGDPLMINVSPDNLGVIDTRFYSFDIDGIDFDYPQYVQIVTPTSNTDQIYLDDVLVTTWEVNPENPSVSFAEISLPDESDDHSIVSTGVAFIAYPSGQLHGRSYGYCIGHNSPFFEPDFEIGYLSDTLNYQVFEDTICSCEPLWFNGVYPDSDATYLWDFGDGSTEFGNGLTHEFSNGNFDVTLTVMNEEGCIMDTLMKYNLVVINCDILMEPIGTICQGDSVTLTSVAGLEWLWSTGETTASIIVAPTETTTYSLEVDGGVTDICEEITVYVYEKQLSTLPDSLTKCSNEELLVTAGVIGDYVWSTGEETEEIYLVETGTYFVSITDSNGCIIEDSVYVFVAEAPIWSLGETIYICTGESVELIPTGEITGEEEYEWSNTETTPSIIVNEAGLYKLTLVDSFCTTVDSVLVNVVYPWELTLDNPFIICAKKVVLNVAQEFSSYLWSTGDTSAQIIADEPGLYGVEVTNVCGMYGGTIEVIFDCTYAFFVPNSFTANGDPMNPVFKGVGVGVEQYYLNIYDRWGELVFESNNIDFGWNGNTFIGEPAPMGSYVYQIEVIDVFGELHKYVGHVNLIR